MTFYSGIQTLSAGLIDDYGTDFTYRRKSLTHDPVVGSLSGSTNDNPGRCVVTQITSEYNELVQVGDKLLLTTSEVHQDDEIDLAGKTYEVIKIFPVEPGGVNVLNKVLIR